MKDKRMFTRLYNLIGKKIYKVYLSLAVALLYALSQAFAPKLMGDVTTMVADGIQNKVKGIGVIDFKTIGILLMICMGNYILNWLFQFLMNHFMIDVSQDIVFKLRNSIASKLGKLPFGYFESRQYGDILATVTNDAKTIADNFQSLIVQVFSSFSYIIILVIVMLVISPLLTVVVLVTLPISAFAVKCVMKKSDSAFKNQQRLIGEINGHIEEKFTGFMILKAFGGENKESEEFRALNNQLCDAGDKAMFLGNLMAPLTAFVGNLGYVAVVVIGGISALGGGMAIGTIQAFVSYVKSFNEPIRQISNMGATIQSINAAAERIFALLDEPEEENDEDAQSIADVKGAVSFKNVAFGYSPEKIIIHNFSLDVKPGQQIAIVGPTGAGKSTILKLLMRFYDINSGEISVDGNRIKDISRESLHDSMGIVLQETWLFEGSIKENIRLGRPNATDDEIVEAAKMAEADYFIGTLPGAYDYMLSENGQNISIGQRQLLTIARAILANRPILILDEATSSVDTQTEARIQSAMNRLMKGRTSFVIAHRLSTIVDSDVILVLKDGDVIEQGNHSELLDRRGFYYELYNAQFA